MAGEHILIIDDDPDVREALKLILEPAGYRLTSCATGPEGRVAVREVNPDVIMLDIMLATVSEGLHVSYEFKKDEAVANIPIIMISSISETVGIDYEKEVGSDYVPAEFFLSKPLDAKRVLETVSQALADARTSGGRPVPDGD